ncbi:hypothetical protein BDQ17DRAFT_1350438 [Cyathus striatus]|nr:hypothetical protein BDQ17DRAFT_1350438 [Cyathus striatus]
MPYGDFGSSSMIKCSAQYNLECQRSFPHIRWCGKRPQISSSVTACAGISLSNQGLDTHRLVELPKPLMICYGLSLRVPNSPYGPEFVQVTTVPTFKDEQTFLPSSTSTPPRSIYGRGFPFVYHVCHIFQSHWSRFILGTELRRDFLCDLESSTFHCA